jgi:hypothetical protein
MLEIIFAIVYTVLLSMGLFIQYGESQLKKREEEYTRKQKLKGKHRYGL